MTDHVDLMRLADDGNPHDRPDPPTAPPAEVPSFAEKVNTLARLAEAACGCKCSLEIYPHRTEPAPPDGHRKIADFLLACRPATIIRMVRWMREKNRDMARLGSDLAAAKALIARLNPVVGAADGDPLPENLYQPPGGVTVGEFRRLRERLAV